MNKRLLKAAGKKTALAAKDRADDVVDEIKRDIENEFGDGTPVREMKPKEILTNGEIRSTTDDGDLIVRYKGESFSVTIDHPEL